MTLESISTLLGSRKTEDRLRGIQRLVRWSGPERQTLLLKALRDRTYFVAAEAAEALGNGADLAAMKEMIAHFHYLAEDGLKRDPGCHVRAKLAFAFGQLECFHADSALRIGIRTVQMEPVGGVPFDTGAHLRANSALALAQIRAPDALRDITLLLFDHGKRIDGSKAVGYGDEERFWVKVEPRKAAARALALLGTPEARVPLALRLTYPGGESPEVLQECMQAIVGLEDPRALELLTPFLDDRDQALAAYAGLMIAQTHAPEALQLLVDLVHRLSGDPLRAAILAITTLRTEQAETTLKQLASDGRATVRNAVKEIVGGN